MRPTERMLGYLSWDVFNKITPAAISDPQEMISRAETLSMELDTQSEEKVGRRLFQYPARTRRMPRLWHIANTR